MAKGAQQQATDLAGQQSKSSTEQTQKGLYGGGAFGPSGLSGNYQQTFKPAFEGTQKAQTYGGYDPTVLNTLRSNAANLATSGGLDPAATGLYKSFVSTGGYSPEDTSRYLRQATSGVQNTYQNLAADAARRRAITGGGGDVTSQMARQLTQAQASSTDKALADIQAQKVSNELAGAKGLESAAELTQKGFAQQAALEKDVSGNVMQANQLMNLMNSQQGQQILSLMGVDTSNQANAMKTLTAMAQQPGIFDNIMRVAGLAVSGAGAAGSLGWKPFAPSPGG